MSVVDGFWKPTSSKSKSGGLPDPSGTFRVCVGPDLNASWILISLFECTEQKKVLSLIPLNRVPGQPLKVLVLGIET